MTHFYNMYPLLYLPFLQADLKGVSGVSSLDLELLLKPSFRVSAVASDIGRIASSGVPNSVWHEI